MTDALPTPLTDEQIDTYYREGYIVVNQLVPAEVCDAVLSAGPQPEEFQCAKNWSPEIFDHSDRKKMPPCISS